MARKPDPFNNPFAAMGKSLKKEIQNKQATKPAPRGASPEVGSCPDRMYGGAQDVRRETPPPKAQVPKAETEEDLFRDAMRGIAPIHGDPRGKASAPPPPEAEDVPLYDEDAEALAELASFVEGEGTFDIADTDEYIEGSISGLDRRIVQRLRRGEFAVRDHVDLHGMTREVARETVEQFILESRRRGHQCVLIVHGRGLHSKDNIPVLKSVLQTWLERGRVSRGVLAFATARPHDGGAGAMYVLLRRLPK